VRKAVEEEKEFEIIFEFKYILLFSPATNVSQVFKASDT
jgi:hypothetical protein